MGTRRSRSRALGGPSIAHLPSEDVEGEMITLCNGDFQQPEYISE